jgi:hypothetical protein
LFVNFMFKVCFLNPWLDLMNEVKYFFNIFKFSKVVDQ